MAYDFELKFGVDSSFAEELDKVKKRALAVVAEIEKSSAGKLSFGLPQAASIERISKSLEVLQSAVSQLGNSNTGDVLSAQFSSFFTSLSSGESALRNLADSLRVIKDLGALKDLGTSAGTAESLEAIKRATSGLSDGIKSAGAELDALGGKAEKVSTIFTKFADTFAKLQAVQKSTLQGFTGEDIGLKLNFESIQSDLALMIKSLGSGAISVEDFSNRLQVLQANAKGTINWTRLNADAVTKLTEAYNRGNVTLDEYKATVSKLSLPSLGDIQGITDVEKLNQAMTTYEQVVKVAGVGTAELETAIRRFVAAGGGIDTVGERIQKVSQIFAGISRLNPAASLTAAMRDLGTVNEPKVFTQIVKSLQQVKLTSVETAAILTSIRLGAGLQTDLSKIQEAVVGIVNSFKASEMGLQGFGIALQRLSQHTGLENFKKALDQAFTSGQVSQKQYISSLTSVGVANDKAVASLEGLRKSMDLNAKQANILSNVWGTLAQKAKTLVEFYVIRRMLFDLAAAVRRSFTEFREFDQAMVNTAAITGATAFQMNKMKTEIVSLSGQVGIGFAEIAKSTEDIARAGLSYEQSMVAVRGATYLAKATMSDMETAVKTVVTAVRSFDLSAEETMQAVDEITQAVNISRLSLEDFSDGFKYVGSISAITGTSLKEASAALGVLADRGLEGGQAGTYLRSTMASLIAPTESMLELFDALNLQEKDFSLTSNTLYGAIRNIKDAIGENNEAWVAFNAEEKRTAQGLAILIDQVDDFKAKIDTPAQGMVFDLVKRQMTSLNASFDLLKNQFNTVMKNVFEALAPILQAAVSAARTFLSVINAIPQSFIRFAVVSVILSGISLALTKVVFGFTAVKASMAATGAGIAASISSIVAWIGMWTSGNYGLAASYHALSLAEKKTVIGLILSIIVSIVAGIVSWISANKRLKDSIVGTLESAQNSYSEIKSLIDSIKSGASDDSSFKRISAILGVNYERLRETTKDQKELEEKIISLLERRLAIEKEILDTAQAEAESKAVKGMENLAKEAINAREHTERLRDELFKLQTAPALNQFDAQAAIEKIRKEIDAASAAELSNIEKMQDFILTIDTLGAHSKETAEVYSVVKKALADLGQTTENSVTKMKRFREVLASDSSTPDVFKSMAAAMKMSSDELKKLYDTASDPSNADAQLAAQTKLSKVFLDNKEVYKTLTDLAKSKTDEDKGQVKLARELVDIVSRRQVVEDLIAETTDKMEEKLKSSISQEEARYKASAATRISRLTNIYNLEKETARITFEETLKGNQAVLQVYMEQAKKAREIGSVAKERAVASMALKSVESQIEDVQKRLIDAMKQRVELTRKMRDLELSSKNFQLDIEKSLIGLNANMSDQQKRTAQARLERDYLEEQLRIIRELATAGDWEEAREKIVAAKSSVDQYASSMKALDDQSGIQQAASYYKELSSLEQNAKTKIVQTQKNQIDAIQELEKKGGDYLAILVQLSAEWENISQTGISGSVEKMDALIAKTKEFGQALMQSMGKEQIAASLQEAEESLRQITSRAAGVVAGQLVPEETGKKMAEAFNKSFAEFGRVAFEKQQDVKINPVLDPEGTKKTRQQLTDEFNKVHVGSGGIILGEIKPETLKKITDQLAAAGKEAVVSPKSAFDPGELFNALQKAADQMRPITFKTKAVFVDVPSSIGAPGMATGGMLSGYGGGDRNLALLEDGEFVMRKEAVKRYGQSLMMELNNMRVPFPDLPKYAQGGPVTNMGTFVFEVGGNAYPVQGSLNTLGDLREALTRLQRSRR